MNLPPTLTVRQVAQLLQVEPRTIRRNIERGDIPAKKIGRVWRIPQSFVIEYLSPGDTRYASVSNNQFQQCDTC